jgi:hypothetical protein
MWLESYDSDKIRFKKTEKMVIKLWKKQFWTTRKTVNNKSE